LGGGEGMTIFVSIAAYCDRLLEQTVRDMLAKASNPDKLRFGIVEQNFAEKRFKHDDIKTQVRYVGIDVRDTRGVCWARSLAMSLYSGESWFMQIDSHTMFDQGWDDRLLKAASQCSQLSPKFLISSYPNLFNMVDGVPVLKKVTENALLHVVNEDCKFESNNLFLLFKGKEIKTTLPVKGFHVAAGFIFTQGRFVYEVPYDPQMYFEGEEQTLAVRAYTHGWDIYHISNNPTYHLYNTDHNPMTIHRELHWTAEEDKQRNTRWWDLNNNAIARMNALLLQGEDLGIYGLGKVRSLVEYANFSGIDYRNKTIADHAKNREDVVQTVLNDKEK